MDFQIYEIHFEFKNLDILKSCKLLKPNIYIETVDASADAIVDGKVENVVS